MKDKIRFKMRIAIAMSILFFTMIGPVWSQPEAPLMSLNQNNDEMTILWTPVGDSQEYILSYAPYPDATYVESFSVGNETQFSFTLWPGAAFYVAVQAKNGEGLSEYSNISYFEINDLDTVADGSAGLVINEIMAKGSAGGFDWFELYNTGTTAVALPCLETRQLPDHR